MTTYRRTEIEKRTIRYEFPGSMDAKTLGIAIAILKGEFRKVHSREPEYDNDFWLEPTDEGIAFVFEVFTERKPAEPGATP